MHGFYDTWANRLTRPLYGAESWVKDRLLDALEAAGRFEHLHGPNEVPCTDEEMVVLCLVRDGELWIPSFVRHHLELGAKHIFFLDNGSTDSTVERARSFPRVTVWRTRLPFGRFEIAFRRWLVRKFGRGRWCLIADVDELFDYPRSGDLPLALFLRYLNRRGFGVVTTQMLDMFSDRSFRELESRPEDDLRETYPYYDLSDVERRRDVFWIDDRIPHHRRLFCAFGGVRERVFGSTGLLQTKHALVRAGQDVRVLPYDGHFSVGPVADVTGVLLHYKFLSNLLEQARTAVREGQHSRGSIHYRAFLRVLSREPDLSLHSETAERLESVDELVEKGFLTTSEIYERWVEAHGGGGRAGAGEPRPEGARR